MPAETDNSKGTVVLLDSNVLGNLSLYFEACASVHKKVGSSCADIISSLSSALTICTDERTKDCLRLGYRGFQNLRTLGSSGHSLDIYVSRVSCLEVMNLYMERSFDEQLSHCNIPFRMRSRRPFRCQVTFDYDEKVESPWQLFLQSMEDEGLPIRYAEEFMGETSQSEGFQLILRATQAIAHSVALEDVDLYLCAAALVIPVDYFYTCDQDVRNVMNSMRSSKDWWGISDRVIDAVCAISEPYRWLVAEATSKYDTIPLVTGMS